MKVMILLAIVLAGYVSCENSQYSRCVRAQCQWPPRSGDNRVCSNQGRTYESECHLNCSPDYEWKESDGPCCEPVCTWEGKTETTCDTESYEQRCDQACPCPYDK